MEPKPEIKPDYRKMVEEWKKSLKVKKVQERPANLYVDGLLFATGVAAALSDYLSFCPQTPKHLDYLPNTPTILKWTSNGTEIVLKSSQELYELGDDSCYYFLYTKENE